MNLSLLGAILAKFLMLVIFGLIFAIFPLSKKDLFSHICEAGAGCWKYVGNTVVATICSVW